MIVAITGGTGFIGKHLIARHVARGDQVRYLTRGETRNDINGAVVYVGNLGSSVETLREFVSGVDVLYHCAAELRNEAKMESTNVLGTSNLLAAAIGEVHRWVQLSSTGVYGSNPNRAICEESEETPANEYEVSKFRSDQLVCEAAATQNLPCVLLRPSNVYGVDMPNQSLFQLIDMVDRGLFFFIGKQGASANYVHVDNVVDALVICGTSSLPAIGRKYIVSDYRTLETFVDVIARSLGKKTPRKRLPEAFARIVVGLTQSIPQFPLKSSRIDALTNRTVYRIERIESELGYKNKITMEEGIGELVRRKINSRM